MKCHAISPVKEFAGKIRTLTLLKLNVSFVIGLNLPVPHE